jgi:uncharacterized repeat protein (TIGR01451 family)
MRNDKKSVLIIFGIFLISNLIYAQPGGTIVVHKSIYSLRGNLDIDLDGDEDIIFDGGWIENENGIYTITKDWSLLVNTYGNEYLLTDVDSDGDYDLWSQYQGGWYENLGDLVFSQFEEFNVNAEFTTIQSVRDFNADGYNDLLVEFDCGCADPDQWSIALNDGNLSFTIVNSVNSLENAYLNTIEDFNGDGILDVFTSLTSVYTIMLCDADAQLEAYNFDASAAPFWYHFGDFNGDGLTDYFSRQELQIYLNQGNLEFQPFGLLPDLTGIVESNFHTTFETDWDQDGDLDLLLGDNLSAVVLANNGSALFEIQSTYNLGSIECVLNTGVDEFDDIIFDNNGAKVVFENNGSELSFSSQLSSHYSSAIDLATADLDGDGDKDIITQGNTGIIWIENGGNDLFSFGSELAVCPECDFVGNYYGYGSFKVLAEDYDMDGDYDVAYSSSSEILLVENLGNGEFANPVTIFDIPENYWSTIHSVDINSDGGVDILYTIQPTFDNQDDGLGVHCLMTDVDLIFYSIPINESIVLSEYDWNFVSFFDYNGDDFKDLIIQSIGNWQLSPSRLLLSDGEGTFIQSEMPAELLRLVSWADIDMDDDLDVVSLNQDNQITYRLNDGVGNLSDEVILFPEMSFMDVRTLDMNLDGLPELLATKIISGSPNYQYAIVYIDNFGNLSFDSPIFFSWIADPIWTDIIVENLNLDPYPEVLFPHAFDIFLIKNLSDAPIDIEYGIFKDTNENGVWDETEMGLSDIPVDVVEIDATIYSNVEGLATFSVLNSGLYSFNLDYDAALWTPTTPTSIQVQLNEGIESNVVYFGLKETGEINAVATAISNPSGICGGVGFQDFILLNNGNTSLTGVLEISIDPMFEFVNAMPAPDLVNGNTLSWSFDGLDPTMSQEVRVWMIFPSFEFSGNEYTHMASASCLDEFMNVLTSDSHSYSNMVACAYDPNDKQAEPIGWEEPHFIESGERIQYKIRFQNTGNAPAQNVVVYDQLDLSTLDLSTFQPVAGSAAYYTCLHDDGLIEFMFLNIELPDSTSDPEGSQGYVIFEIETLDNLAGGTEILNHAEIVFDFNPAIITNETWHTIMDCGSFSGPELNDTFCESESIEVNASQNYMSEYSWTIDGQVVDEDSFLNTSFSEAGSYEVILSMSNPLCEFEEVLSFPINPIPNVTAGEDVSICQGDMATLVAEGADSYLWTDLGSNDPSIEVSPLTSTLYNVVGTTAEGCENSDMVWVNVFDFPGDQIVIIDGALTAPEGSQWSWFFNGSPISDATEQTFVPFESGSYTVQTISENGCTTFSQEYIFNGLDNFGSKMLEAYPNPVSEELFLVLPDGIWDLTLMDAMGRNVAEIRNAKATQTLPFMEYPAGIYLLKAIGNGNQSIEMKIIKN